RYALNAAANLRWFYPEYLPRENQSRPDLTPSVPYERLNREAHGKTPYAEGDFAGHRSVYGGAYVMWLDKMVKPLGHPWLLQWDLTRTNFLDRGVPPTFLYYNPFSTAKSITVEAAGQVRDLAHDRILPAHQGRVELKLGPEEARVIEIQH
ncbi:MAG: hypothetical protein WB341_03590, partial [Terracidiphilus sp.]